MVPAVPPPRMSSFFMSELLSCAVVPRGRPGEFVAGAEGVTRSELVVHDQCRPAGIPSAARTTG
jgi:hypothetical protein